MESEDRIERERARRLQLSGQMAQSGAQSGTVTGAAGGGLAGYGMYTADPYTMTAGLALQTLGSVQARKKQEREANERAKYQARLSKLDNQLRAIENLQNVSKGLRNL